MNSRYALDKGNAKLLGVCAGLARTTGVDLVLVRIAVALLTLFALGPLALVAYFLIALIAESR